MSETTDETRDEMPAADVERMRSLVKRLLHDRDAANAVANDLAAQVADLDDSIKRLEAERDAAIAERDAARRDAAEARAKLEDACEESHWFAMGRAAALAAEMAASLREDARYRMLLATRERREAAAAALEALRDRLGGCDG